MARHFNLLDFQYAHRGLWSRSGTPENSLAAFRAAKANGLGVEFDVRPSRDREIMVFHDPDLKRLTRSTALFETLDAQELRDIELAESGAGIPTFEAMLEIWPQHLPLLTEMKIDGVTDAVAFARSVGARLSAWNGCAAAMSFSEAAVDALPSDLMRGQLIYPSSRNGEHAFRDVFDRALTRSVNYIALHHSDVHHTQTAMRAGKPVVTWTVRTSDDLARARQVGAAMIFEHIALSAIKQL